jgi:hypothetical protein
MWLGAKAHFFSYLAEVEVDIPLIEKSGYYTGILGGKY